jgi:molybdopterin converting factor small subunit
MSTVRIPPVLRSVAGNQKQVTAAGETVGAVVQALVAAYPGLRDQLLTPDGALNRFVNVYLNNEDVRYLRELDTPAGDRDTIVILPAMAGGGI